MKPPPLPPSNTPPNDHTTTPGSPAGGRTNPPPPYSHHAASSKSDWPELLVSRNLQYALATPANSPAGNPMRPSNSFVAPHKSFGDCKENNSDRIKASEKYSPGWNAAARKKAWVSNFTKVPSGASPTTKNSSGNSPMKRVLTERNETGGILIPASPNKAVASLEESLSNRNLPSAILEAANAEILGTDIADEKPTEAIANLQKRIQKFLENQDTLLSVRSTHPFKYDEGKPSSNLSFSPVGTIENVAPYHPVQAPFSDRPELLRLQGTGLEENLTEGGEMLPYDPKHNFLSPRPKFLRYRPPQSSIRTANECYLISGHNVLDKDKDLQSNENLGKILLREEEKDFKGESKNLSEDIRATAVPCMLAATSTFLREEDVKEAAPLIVSDPAIEPKVAIGIESTERGTSNDCQAVSNRAATDEQVKSTQEVDLPGLDSNENGSFAAESWPDIPQSKEPVEECDVEGGDEWSEASREAGILSTLLSLLFLASFVGAILLASGSPGLLPSGLEDNPLSSVWSTSKYHQTASDLLKGMEGLWNSEVGDRSYPLVDVLQLQEKYQDLLEKGHKLLIRVKGFRNSEVGDRSYPLVDVLHLKKKYQDLLEIDHGLLVRVKTLTNYCSSLGVVSHFGKAATSLKQFFDFHWRRKFWPASDEIHLGETSSEWEWSEEVDILSEFPEWEWTHEYDLEAANELVMGSMTESERAKIRDFFLGLSDSLYVKLLLSDLMRMEKEAGEERGSHIREPFYSSGLSSSVQRRSESFSVGVEGTGFAKSLEENGMDKGGHEELRSFGAEDLLDKKMCFDFETKAVEEPSVSLCDEERMGSPYHRKSDIAEGEAFERRTMRQNETVEEPRDKDGLEEAIAAEDEDEEVIKSIVEFDSIAISTSGDILMTGGVEPGSTFKGQKEIPVLDAVNGVSALKTESTYQVQDAIRIILQIWSLNKTLLIASSIAAAAALVTAMILLFPLVQKKGTTKVSNHNFGFIKKSSTKLNNHKFRFLKKIQPSTDQQDKPIVVRSLMQELQDSRDASLGENKNRSTSIGDSPEAKETEWSTPVPREYADSATSPSRSAADSPYGTTDQQGKFSAARSLMQELQYMRDASMREHKNKSVFIGNPLEARDTEGRSPVPMENADSTTCHLEGAADSFFGSFTTYKCVPKKEGQASDSKKIRLTPVRRSSRLRNQATMSPNAAGRAVISSP